MRRPFPFFLAAFLSLVPLLPALPPQLSNGRLLVNDQPVLTGVDPNLHLVADPTGAGGFLRLQLPEPRSYVVTPLGRIEALDRFTLTHRYEPYWMRPAAGRSHAEIPAETQWILARTTGGAFVLVVPLLDGAARFALHGDEAGLQLTCETGDAYTPVSGGVAVYVARGDDPYALLEAAGRAVARQLGNLPLREAKPVPDFVDDFGWCTWDAFYHDVDPAGVQRGLESFAAGGVQPRFLILDDGWQSTRRMRTGETRLTAFAPNEKFGGDLSSLVRFAKDRHGIREFLVWHAVVGYWGGVDGEGLGGYGVIDAPRSYGVGILKHEPHVNVQWWGNIVGFVPPDQIARFYDDYHASLARQGVDGVKVDSQAMLESLGTGHGGRVAVQQAYRQGLEASVQKHFAGRLINCMSHGQETIYGSPQSTVMRTSIDFWPRRPETHGLHLYINSQVGAWFGRFMQPDWDMFQSGHEWGAFHAAGRAVSGGPVYVSDKPGAHDFALLRKLVLHDGTILRADQPGRPTADCLLVDPTREDVLLKIFNTNGPRGVVGVFNARYSPDAPHRRLSGQVRAADVVGLPGADFAAFRHTTGEVRRVGANDALPLELPSGGWELVSYSPISDGAAVLGLADKFNSTGAVTATRRASGDTLEVELRDGGRFLAWSEREPRELTAGGVTLPFEFDRSTGAIRATLPSPGRQTVILRW